MCGEASLKQTNSHNHYLQLFAHTGVEVTREKKYYNKFIYFFMGQYHIHIRVNFSELGTQHYDLAAWIFFFWICFNSCIFRFFSFMRDSILLSMSSISAVTLNKTYFVRYFIFTILYYLDSTLKMCFMLLILSVKILTQASSTSHFLGPALPPLLMILS